MSLGIQQTKLYRWNARSILLCIWVPCDITLRNILINTIRRYGHSSIIYHECCSFVNEYFRIPTQFNYYNDCFIFYET